MAQEEDNYYGHLINVHNLFFTAPKKSKNSGKRLTIQIQRSQNTILCKIHKIYKQQNDAIRKNVKKYKKRITDKYFTNLQKLKVNIKKNLSLKKNR